MQADRIVSPIERAQFLPEDGETEARVLGAILLDPSSLLRVRYLLSPDDFAGASNQIVYESILQIADAGETPNMGTVARTLKASGKLDAVGGQSALATLIDSALSSATIDLDAAAIVRLAKHRRLYYVALQLYRLSNDASQSLPEMLPTFIDRLAELGASQRRDVFSIGEIVGQVMSEIEEKRVDEGVDTGFLGLNAITQGGLRGGELVILAGRPSMGKSALSAQIGLNVSTTRPVLFFSLEMSRQQIARRFIQMEVPVGAGLVKGDLTESQTMRIFGLPIASNENFLVCDNASVTPAEMRVFSKMEAAKRGGLGLVIVDYLQLMAGGDDRNRATEIGRITRSLKLLARELDCPILLLSQLSRGVESRTNKRPIMSDLRESGRIEEDADQVWMIYREEYYEPDTADRGIAEVLVRKNRAGSTGTVKLLFAADKTKFADMPSWG